VLILFLDVAPAKDALREVSAPGGEQLALLGRELFISFPNGQGQSKLKVPFANIGTGRNINTVTKLAEIAAALAAGAAKR
jgi:uncharacterized protein (DUF1697 family)